MLFVLKSFINSLLYVKSNECRSALCKLQHSNPYNSIGKHLDLTIVLESPPQMPDSTAYQIHRWPHQRMTVLGDWKNIWRNELWQRRSRDISFQRPRVNIDHRQLNGSRTTVESKCNHISALLVPAITTLILHRQQTNLCQCTCQCSWDL